MTLEQFIDENREEIDAIMQAEGSIFFDDEEREIWIQNHETLYDMAINAGVEL